MIRIIVAICDGMLDGVIGPVGYETFDIEAPELEECLKIESRFMTREVIGAEVRDEVVNVKSKRVEQNGTPIEAEEETEREV